MIREITARGQSHIGKVRSSNQDAFLIDEKEQLYIVADGMGGHAGGEIASQLCTKCISEYLNKNMADQSTKSRQSQNQILAVMTAAVNLASAKIYEYALEDPVLRGMGTTATVVKVIDDHAFCAHVGDSRFYLLRSKFLYQLTSDHSLVSEQLRAGIITQKEAESHHLKNIITRSVGYQEEEDVDTLSLKLEKGDILILCSDGLYGKVHDKEIVDMVKKYQIEAAERLIALANERGGEDNITVITGFF